MVCLGMLACFARLDHNVPPPLSFAPLGEACVEVTEVDAEAVKGEGDDGLETKGEEDDATDAVHDDAFVVRSV